jgi:phosphotriesterase-related protein
VTGDRRSFLKSIVLAIPAPLVGAASVSGSERRQPQVMTVDGPLATDRLGMMLPHEHVLVDFIGADRASPARYDPEEVFQVMLPYLRQAHASGCRTMAECTPAYLGRDPLLLRRLSAASGIQLLTNTGLYGARSGKFLPADVAELSVEELAGRWIAEFREGIDGTGIRPGFIKIGVDAGALPAAHRKLLRAAARCHLETGLTIAGHTGDGQAALEQVSILREAGVAPSAWIWVHAQNEPDTDVHRRVAEAGGWVEFDGVGPASIARHVQLVRILRDAGLLHRVLLSHDAGWYSVGEPRGGTIRGFGTLAMQLLPALRKAGLSEEEIRQLTVANPAQAFAIGVRAR